MTNALIEQSPFEAIQWVEGTITGVNLSDVSIIGTGTFALQEQTPGSATLTNVTATGVAQANEGNAPSYSCEGTGFVITDDGGNSGISPTQCNGDAPTPVYPPYPVTGVNASPTALTFGPQVTGTTSAAQSVTVSNPTSAAASVSSISASGPFAQTNNCGSSIAANGSCTVNVTFSPTATGTSTGSLTVNAGGVTSTVSLTGTGTAPGPVLSASPASLSFPSTLVGNYRRHPDGDGDQLRHHRRDRLQRRGDRGLQPDQQLHHHRGQRLLHGDGQVHAHRGRRPIPAP